MDSDLIPTTIALAAALIATLISSRLRTIVEAIFRKPSSRSVVLTIDDQTLVLNDVSVQEEQRLVDQFIAQHSAGQQADAPRGNTEPDAEAEE